MNNIRVDIRLRPIRLGFLVRPDDKENILEIFRINTCLWGGRFNPIIPFFESVPLWWKKYGFRFENPKQIINGHLDFFEPDFLVEAEEGLANGLGFNEERIMQLTDVRERTERMYGAYGLSVHSLYWELYQEEFRFESRYQHDIVHVEAKESAFASFVAANFGSFLIQEQLEDFERAYQDVFKDIFNPEHIILDAAALLELYQSRYISALQIGYEKLHIDYNEFSSPMLFILDAQESKDLVDFWNLRAIHRHVIAVPIQWIEQFSSFCKNFILNNSRPLRGNRNGTIIYPTLMFSRFMPEDNIEKIYRNYLHIGEENSNVIPIQYPPDWREPPEDIFRTTRPTLEADRKSMDIQIDGDNPEIRFDLPFPEFANEYRSELSLANVIRLEDGSNAGQIATVFPWNYKNPTVPKFGSGRKYLLPTTEGLVIFPKHRDFSEQWNLVDGTTTFSQWFKDNQVLATLSDAGRATHQIIQTLGDFGDLDCLAHKGVIELLNKISNRPVTKTAHYQKFRKKIGYAIKNEILKERIFETLVKRKVVELGLELKCSKCGSRSWYSIKQLDYSLVCDLCFKQFDFPITNPVDSKNSRWAYRVIGPFALPDYARGGYAASLAIRFFADVIGRRNHSSVTWSPGQELMLPTGETVESDFILWFRRNEFFGPAQPPPEMVFGEVKSFGRSTFKQTDIDRMQLLAETFPGSILVFATMREKTDLSKGEINRIKKLAEWGREYDKERRQTLAPVIVLTGTELFTANSLEALWKQKRGKYTDVVRRAQARTDNLRVLAGLTQELYLEMPPYDRL